MIHLGSPAVKGGQDPQSGPIAAVRKEPKKEQQVKSRLARRRGSAPVGGRAVLAARTDRHGGSRGGFALRRGLGRLRRSWWGFSWAPTSPDLHLVFTRSSQGVHIDVV